MKKMLFIIVILILLASNSFAEILYLDTKTTDAGVWRHGTIINVFCIEGYKFAYHIDTMSSSLRQILPPQKCGSNKNVHTEKVKNCALCHKE